MDMNEALERASRISNSDEGKKFLAYIALTDEGQLVEGRTGTDIPNASMPPLPPFIMETTKKVGDEALNRLDPLADVDASAFTGEQISNYYEGLIRLLLSKAPDDALVWIVRNRKAPTPNRPTFPELSYYALDEMKGRAPGLYSDILALNIKNVSDSETAKDNESIKPADVVFVTVYPFVKKKDVKKSGRDPDDVYSLGEKIAKSCNPHYRQKPQYANDEHPDAPREEESP